VIRANIGLGSNLGDSAAIVRRAMSELGTLGEVVARSSLFRTKPWGVTEQPDFINAVVALEAALEPRALLAELKALEVRLGRVAGERWGPRVIDLDILTYGTLEVDEPGLEIPHPQLRERAFVLAPLSEIAPDYRAAFEALPEAERATVRRLAPEADSPPGAPKPG
jgi:2-amino-4-hydroxy-6-hydroxymethyldihydropteridine diphosphokinase